MLSLLWIKNEMLASDIDIYPRRVRITTLNNDDDDDIWFDFRFECLWMIKSTTYSRQTHTNGKTEIVDFWARVWGVRWVPRARNGGTILCWILDWKRKWNELSETRDVNNSTKIRFLLTGKWMKNDGRQYYGAIGGQTMWCPHHLIIIIIVTMFVAKCCSAQFNAFFLSPFIRKIFLLFFTVINIIHKLFSVSFAEMVPTNYGILWNVFQCRSHSYLCLWATAMWKWQWEMTNEKPYK